MVPLAQSGGGGEFSRVMLTGSQIAAARKLAGIKTQADLAVLADVSEPTIARAEAKGAEIPGMNTAAMAAIIRALEGAGVQFFTKDGGTLAGGVGMRLIEAPAAASGGAGVRLKEKGGE